MVVFSFSTSHYSVDLMLLISVGGGKGERAGGEVGVDVAPGYRYNLLYEPVSAKRTNLPMKELHQAVQRS